MTHLGEKNGNGLTKATGFLRRRRESTHDVVRAALLTSSVPLQEVHFKRDKIVVVVRTEDVLTAQRRPVRPLRVVKTLPTVRDPHGLEGRRPAVLQATELTSARWW